MPKGIKGFQKGNNNPRFGKKPWNFKKHPTKETLRKQSESHMGYVMPEEQRKNIGLGNKGKKKPFRSKEHRRKIGNSRRGEKSHFWIDGRSREKNKYPQDWVSYLRESIRKRDCYICQICGTHQDELNFGQVKALDIHHIDYDKNNLNPKNLISLCRSCHMKTNYHRKYWIEYFKTYEQTQT